MMMNCQLYWNFAILHFILGSHLIFFYETCLFYLSLCCFEITRCFLQSLFWQNILIELQHAIKANQSWKFKSILIVEMTQCLLKTYGVPKKFLSSHMKLNHPPCSKVLAVCIMTCNGLSSYGLANQGSCKSKSLHWTMSKFIGSHRPCLKWEKAILDIPSLSKEIYPLQSISNLIKYSFKKKPWPGSHPTLGANKRRQKWKGMFRTKVQCLRKSSKKEDLDLGHIRKIWERLCEKNTWNLPPLEGRSNIMEREFLLSIGKTKEVSIKKRHNKYQKSIP